MLKQDVNLEYRDLGKDPLSAAELDRLIGDRNHLEFLNTRNALYRARRLKDKPPSRAEALQLMSQEPNLIRRPLVIRGSKIVLGFDAQAYKELSS